MSPVSSLPNHQLLGTCLHLHAAQGVEFEFLVREELVADDSARRDPEKPRGWQFFAKFWVGPPKVEEPDRSTIPVGYSSRVLVQVT